MDMEEARQQGATVQPGETATSTEPPFTLRLAENRMALYFTGVVLPESKDQLMSQVSGELIRLGLGGGSQLVQASRRLDEALANGQSDLHDYILLQGAPPLPPKEASLEWAANFFESGYVVDPSTGLADYRRRLGRLSVAEGEHLATLIPAEAGVDGQDLMGHSVPAARPKPFRVRAGANVRFDEAEGKYFATRDGRIRFTGSALIVDDVFTVSGSVNLKTGHIKHPGTLLVSVNIESEAEVETQGDIEVNGIVENSVITTTGTLLVHGGITGGPRCKIRAEGGVHAQFIRNADIESNGDVIAEHEIDQSIIKTRGTVAVLHGRIVGGEIMALGGIEADQIGSEAYVRTNLSAGEDYRLKELTAKRETELESRRDALRKISERLAPLKERSRNLPPRLRELATTLLNEASKINEAIREAQKELDAARADSATRMRKEVYIRREIYPDAFFFIPPLNMLVRDHVDGPVKVVIQEGDIHLVQTRER